MTSPLAITSASPAVLKLRPGQHGAFSFTVAGPIAEDRAIDVVDVVLEALLVEDDGSGKVIDWLVVGPQRTLRLAKGQTETVTIRHFNGAAWSPIPGLSAPPITVWLSRA